MSTGGVWASCDLFEQLPRGEKEAPIWRYKEDRGQRSLVLMAEIEMGWLWQPNLESMSLILCTFHQFRKIVL